MKAYRVYLAGSITGSTPKSATGWRDYAKTKLMRHGILAYSPTRGKEKLASVYSDDKPLEVDAESTLGGPENTTRGIMMRDYLDCIHSDALLVFLDPHSTKLSLGTSMELAWAYHLKIPTVVCTAEDSYYYRHPMVNEATIYRVDSIDQGIDIIVSILMP